MPISAVLIFYGLMTALGVILTLAFGLPLLNRPEFLLGAAGEGALASSLLRAAGIGAGVGLVVVALSQLSERYTQWGSELNEGLKSLIGPQSLSAVALMASCSSIGEELLFRAFLQQWIELWAMSSVASPWPIITSIFVAGLAFGLMHIGPKWRTFWPWTLMAVIMGWVLGALFVWTGSLVAPITTHLVINGINLALMARQGASQET